MLEWLSLTALLPFLSQKAAGVGLTITSAHHVVHYTRWWNPAVENQATDRAYRIGQEKEVFVYQKEIPSQPTEATLAEMKQQVLLQATLDGINFSFLFATAIALVALILAFFIKRATPMEEKKLKKVNVQKKSFSISTI